MAKVAFTAGRVAGFKCPADKLQAFLWDATQAGLGLRTTPAGKPAYVFQSMFDGRTLRITIGSPDAWSIPDAQARARELQRLIDEGRDPREVKAAITAADVARREDAQRQTVTVAEAWAAYLLERRPHWGERHYLDHVAKAAPGGVMGKRSEVLRPGILAALMPLALRDLDAATIEAWAAREAKTRPTSARLAWRLLKAFLGWCAEQPAYAGAVSDKNPAKSKKARESLGRPGVKSDSLQREQLPGWFDAVQGIPNTVAAAYLQTLLLTGARPGEVLEMRWDDLNLNPKWRSVTIRDKVEGERTIPLTPYVAHLMAGLPRRNHFVFSGARADVAAKPSGLHARACTVAGIPGLTLHGLRRSFKSLTEWLDIPAGVVAQLMGHKPSATAERHYTVRPLDLLRVHHERIEAWILKMAKIDFDPAEAAPGGLRVVASAA
jgi:integrase